MYNKTLYVIILADAVELNILCGQI